MGKWRPLVQGAEKAGGYVHGTGKIKRSSKPIAKRGPKEKLYHGTDKRLRPGESLKPSSQHLTRSGQYSKKKLKGVYATDKGNRPVARSEAISRAINNDLARPKIHKNVVRAKGRGYVYSMKKGPQGKHGKGWHTPSEPDYRIPTKGHLRDNTAEVMSRKRVKPSHVTQIKAEIRNDLSKPMEGGKIKITHGHTYAHRGRHLKGYGQSKTMHDNLPKHTSTQQHFTKKPMAFRKVKGKGSYRPGKRNG